MRKVKLVTFRYRFTSARDVQAAWFHAWGLSVERGNREAPPTRGRKGFLLIRIHPDDEPKLTAYCRALDLGAGQGHKTANLA